LGVDMTALWTLALGLQQLSTHSAELGIIGEFSPAFRTLHLPPPVAIASSTTRLLILDRILDLKSRIKDS